MAHRKCTICDKDIVLVPSAKERARTSVTGETEKYFLDLFTTHSKCAVEKRERETLELMRRKNNK